ncbi:MAG: DUF378 domain-containing protein [Candidatus Levybacteria bacterium]|nr:DUF378 domain-containing protein [Candidatus Levybacteria bacterium]
MKRLPMIAWWLAIIGAVNWLLVGLGAAMGGNNWNVVELVFGSWPGLVNLVYILVGLSGVWLLWNELMGSKKK